MEESIKSRLSLLGSILAEFLPDDATPCILKISPDNFGSCEIRSAEGRAVLVLSIRPEDLASPLDLILPKFITAALLHGRSGGTTVDAYKKAIPAILKTSDRIPFFAKIWGVEADGVR